MIKHIKINNFKGIRTSILLKNLGKINILCGKNNSGKSTILNAINENKFSIGINNDNFDHAFIYDQVLKVFGEDIGWEEGNERRVLYFNGSVKEHNIVQEVFKKELIHEYLNESVIIWSSDTKALSDRITESGDNASWEYASEYDEDHGMMHNASDKEIYSSASIILQSLVKSLKGKIIFIDPKRDFPHQISNSDLDQKTIVRHLYYLDQSKKDVDVKLIKKIRDAYLRITDGFDFRLQVDEDLNLSIYFGRDGKKFILANRCGLGLRDVLYIVYTIMTNDKSKLILLEEPENHLHPGLQRKLLDFIHEIPNKQFIISTHSNIFLDMRYVDQIFGVKFDGHVELNEISSQAILLERLGYEITDNIVSDLIILVEGPSDKLYIGEILRKKGLLSNYNIKIWALGGGIMNSHDLTVLTQTNKVIALLDNDPEEDRDKFLSSCLLNGIEVFTLKRYAIENYYTIRALKEVFGTIITVNDDFVIDPDIPVKKQEIGSVGLKRGDYPLRIAKQTDWDEIKNTDIGEFILWVEKKNKNFPQ